MGVISRDPFRRAQVIEQVVHMVRTELERADDIDASVECQPLDVTQPGDSIRTYARGPVTTISIVVTRES